MKRIGGVGSIGPELGLVREGTVTHFNKSNGTLTVRLNLAKSDTIEQTIEIPVVAAWTGPKGEFSGGYPEVGSTVWVATGQGGRWASIGYGKSDSLYTNSSSNKVSGYELNYTSKLKPGRYLTQVRNNIYQYLDPDTGIQLGSPTQVVHADPKLEILSNTFKQNLSFTEAHRQVIGPVRRDKVSNHNRDITTSALYGHGYQTSTVKVGLDPSSKAGDSFQRNPGFVECRSLVYEFENSFGFTNDSEEIALYAEGKKPSPSNFFVRYDSRADTLSLSLDNPNHLIETTLGTVVDLYGNLLDINRSPLPNGKVERLRFRQNEKDPDQTFLDLRRETRKSIAYHFELNARKDESNVSEPVDVDSKNNYARSRSRLFLDIDKEGQFKINIPASSETGNIGLPVRYENYSALSAKTNSHDPGLFLRNASNQDIFLDMYGKGHVALTSEAEDVAAFAFPKDRLNDDAEIKLGTVFHDISSGLDLHRRENPIIRYPESLLNKITPIEKLVEEKIIVSGPGANAGGRSGTVCLDGMVNLSIGANTVDRQSLWLDTAGGVISRLGRDKRGVSAGFTLDGDLLIQIGSDAPADDSRFQDDNERRDGVLDIRIRNNAQMHVFRIDSQGITMYSPGNVDIVSEGSLRLKAKSELILDGKVISMYANELGTYRVVNRKPGKTVT